MKRAKSGPQGHREAADRAEAELLQLLNAIAFGESPLRQLDFSEDAPPILSQLPPESLCQVEEIRETVDEDGARSVSIRLHSRLDALKTLQHYHRLKMASELQSLDRAPDQVESLLQALGQSLEDEPAPTSERIWDFYRIWQMVYPAEAINRRLRIALPDDLRPVERSPERLEINIQVRDGSGREQKSTASEPSTRFLAPERARSGETFTTPLKGAVLAGFPPSALILGWSAGLFAGAAIVALRHQPEQLLLSLFLGLWLAFLVLRDLKMTEGETR